MVFLGIITILVGFLVIFVVKIQAGKSHFTSLHGQLGLALIVWSVVQAIVGFLQHEYNILPKKFPISPRLLHSVSGGLFFLLACLVIGLGFNNNWFQSRLAASLESQILPKFIIYLLNALLVLLSVIVWKQVNDKYISLTWKRWFQKIKTESKSTAETLKDVGKQHKKKRTLK